MPATPLHMVTGAFGYSGKYIARALLAKGSAVRTLTNSPHRENEFNGKVEAFPFSFEQPERLTGSLRGVDTLYNTYWIRFDHASFRQSDAIKNTSVLFDCAKTAGVRKIVHISIANPSPDSPLAYYRGKAKLEKMLMDSGVPYAILRPTVIFGGEDILINNIAWMLRHLPLFGVFGRGNYCLQPVYVEDLARLAISSGESSSSTIVNAVGPETYSFREFIALLLREMHLRRLVLPVPPIAGYVVASLIGMLMRDVLLTQEEIKGLMMNLLCVGTPPTGSTRLSQWVHDHADELGRKYASELSRRRDRISSYQSLVR